MSSFLQKPVCFTRQVVEGALTLQSVLITLLLVEDTQNKHCFQALIPQDKAIAFNRKFTLKVRVKGKSCIYQASTIHKGMLLSYQVLPGDAFKESWSRNQYIFTSSNSKQHKDGKRGGKKD